MWKQVYKSCRKCKIKLMMQKLMITTSKNHEVIDITKILNDLLFKNGCYEGISIIFCMSTSCALASVNLDGVGINEDYINAYEALVPKINYKNPQNPDNFGAHLLSSSIGVSLCVPVQSGSLVLGLNQKIGLIEFSGPKERHITLNFLKITESGAL